MFQEGTLIFLQSKHEIIVRFETDGERTVKQRFAESEDVTVEHPALVEIADFYDDAACRIIHSCSIP